MSKIAQGILLCSIGVLLLAASVICALILYFGNPDMTQQRLIITFWREYLGIIVLFISGWLMIGHADLIERDLNKRR